MKRSLLLIGLLLGLSFMTNSVQAQENAVPTDVGSAALSPEAMALRLEVTARLTQFSDDLHQLMAVGKVNMSVDCMYGIPKSVVTTLEQRMQSLNQSTTGWT